MHEAEVSLLQVQIRPPEFYVAPRPLGKPGDGCAGELHPVKRSEAIAVIGIRCIPSIEHLLKLALPLLADRIAPLVAGWLCRCDLAGPLPTRGRRCDPA